LPKGIEEVGMYTVGELKKILDKLPDDLPVMTASRYNGYDPAARAYDTYVCFQGIHGESGEWEKEGKAKPEHKANGSIRALIVESD
jgi:hypothetical protein